MNKVDQCPKCKAQNPAVTLLLMSSREYDLGADTIPDTRTYDLMCLNCGASIDKFKIDNTITAIKALRDEMDNIYGKSEIFPTLVD